MAAKYTLLVTEKYKPANYQIYFETNYLELILEIVSSMTKENFIVVSKDIRN